MISAAKLRQLDIDHNTKVLSLMTDEQQYKTECYAIGKWVTVTRRGDVFTVKAGRSVQSLSLADAVTFLVDSHAGAEHAE